jgi:hypothetical protein
MSLDIKVVVDTREQIGGLKISEGGILMVRYDNMTLMIKRRLNLQFVKVSL